MELNEVEAIKQVGVDLWPAPSALVIRPSQESRPGFGSRLEIIRGWRRRTIGRGPTSVRAPFTDAAQD